MFHEMSRESKAALADELEACQRRLLLREKATRKTPRFPGDEITTPELPPGSAHVYRSLESMLEWLKAPEVQSRDKIDEHSNHQYLHRTGCFSITYITRHTWHVTEMYMETPYPVWVLERIDGAMWLHRSQSPSKHHMAGDSWLAVINAIREYNI